MCHNKKAPSPLGGSARADGHDRSGRHGGIGFAPHPEPKALGTATEYGSEATEYGSDQKEGAIGNGPRATLHMILRCNYEQLQALRSGAAAFLGLDAGVEGQGVAAPPLARSRVEALLSRLDGDLSIQTLSEQRELEAGVRAVVEFLENEMKALVGQMGPTDEATLDAYTEFAQAYAVLLAVRDMGSRMEALIEIMVGPPISPEIERGFEFPD